MRKEALVIGIIACTSLGVLAENQPREGSLSNQTMQSIQFLAPLLVKAIQSENGEASLVMDNGPLMDHLKRNGISSEPLHINVTTLKRFKQQNCSRLNIQFTQDHVSVAGDMQPRKREIDYQISYCIDGTPPKNEGSEYVEQSKKQFATLHEANSKDKTK